MSGSRVSRQTIVERRPERMVVSARDQGSGGVASCERHEDCCRRWNGNDRASHRRGAPAAGPRGSYAQPWRRAVPSRPEHRRRPGSRACGLRRCHRCQQRIAVREGASGARRRIAPVAGGRGARRRRASRVRVDRGNRARANGVLPREARAGARGRRRRSAVDDRALDAISRPALFLAVGGRASSRLAGGPGRVSARGCAGGGGCGSCGCNRCAASGAGDDRGARGS